MSLYKQFTLRHGRTIKGYANTDRVYLDFDAELTTNFFSFLAEQCDELAIQGVVGAYRDSNDQSRVLLIISNTVNTEETAIIWIVAANNVIKELDTERLERFAEQFDVKSAMAVSAESSSGVSITSRGLSTDA